MHLCKQNDEFMWQQMYMYTPNVENCRMRKKRMNLFSYFLFYSYLSCSKQPKNYP